MKKFSTILATLATGAVLTTTGVGAASAAGPETDSMETLRGAVAEGMAGMKSALATGPATAADSTSTHADTAPLELTSASGQPSADAGARDKLPKATAETNSSLERTGSTASAAGGIRDSCVGSLLESEDLVNGYGTTIGRVELWYSSTAGPGGQNCVITHNYLDGGPTFTDASVWVDDDNFGGGESRWSYDEGFYYSYAGGSYVNDVNGKCTAMYGKVEGHDDSSDKDDASYESDWYHCG